MTKILTPNQMLGEIGEAAVRRRFLDMGFQFDGRGGSATRRGQGVDIGRAQDQSVKPGDPRTPAYHQAAAADRGDQVHEADLRALFR
jgi:hypothetical protein